MEKGAFNLKIPKQSLKDLVPQALPVCEPVIAVRQYYLSRAAEQNPRKKIEWDVARLTPAADLVTAHRKLEKAKNSLFEKRELAVLNRKEMDEKWNALKEQEKKLRHAFIHFNQFLKDNEEKRKRAQNKEEKDKLQIKEKEDDIKKLEARIEYLNEVKQAMEKYVNKYKMYEIFLENVCSEYNEFSTVFDVLNRYDTLAATNQEITKRQIKHFLDLENCRKGMIRLTEEKTNVMIGLNNKLAQLQKQFDKARRETLHWEAAVSHIKDVTAAKSLELEMVRTASWNMYQLICQRKKRHLTLTSEDVKNQLICIKHTIQQLKNIERKAKIEAKKAAASTNVASSASEYKASSL